MTTHAHSTDAIQQLVDTAIAFVSRTGVKVIAYEQGYVKLRMPLANNTNHIGTMYAGALFTLAEIPGGILTLDAFDMQRYFPVVAEIQLEFVKPAATDIEVEARLSPTDIARITEEAETSGKSHFTLTLTLTDDSGETVAISQGQYQLRQTAWQSENAE